MARSGTKLDWVVNVRLLTQSERHTRHRYWPQTLEPVVQT
jgi:hypothetical protein